MINSEKIAKIMCDITEEILWNPRKDWAKKKRSDVSLILRIGSGKKTYVSSSRENAGPLKLTYGKKMIEEKLDPTKMMLWLSGREISQRNYYGGELTLLTLLAHTIVHEFAHVIQILMGANYNSSVHNNEFYKILDTIHSKEISKLLLHELDDRCKKIGVDLSTYKSNDNTVKSTYDFSPGDTVILNSQKNDQYNPFKVLKRNPKRIVIQSNVNNKILLSTPPSLLHKVDDKKSKPASSATIINETLLMESSLVKSKSRKKRAKQIKKQSELPFF